jgi:uncharacterized protein
VTTPEDLDQSPWYLRTITEIPHVQHALTMTLDGMVQAKSAHLTRDQADGIGAMTATMFSAARACTNAAHGAHPDTPLRTLTTETASGLYMVMPVGEGTNTLIAAAGDTNMPMGVVAHTMAVQAKKLGEQMSVPARVGEGAS